MKAVMGPLLLTALLLAPVAAGAESARDLVESGNRSYAAGDYDKALEAYGKALGLESDAAEILFNQGNALFMKGDYDKAREAYQAAALKTRDLALEAAAHYNSGNTDFADGRRQLETDPRKALSRWGESVRQYQEALRKDPSLKEAAQNIEMVRLAMKDLADRMKQAEQQAREQQERREAIQREIEEVLGEQQARMEQNQALRRKAEQEPPESTEREARKLAEEQEKTREKTGEVADKLKALESGDHPGSDDPGKAGPDKTPARENLEKAMDAQRSASGKLEKTELEEAQGDQQEAVRRLQEALEALKSSKGDGERQKDSQAGDSDERQPSGAERASEESKEDARQHAERSQAPDPKAGESPKEQGDRRDDAIEGARFSESPESILREEKDNRLQLQRTRQGGIKPVEKDW